MQDDKAVTAWSSGPANDGIGSSPSGRIYFYSILLKFIINFEFFINVFSQIRHL
jgi:hypothetical protein